MADKYSTRGFFGASLNAARRRSAARERYSTASSFFLYLARIE